MKTGNREPLRNSQLVIGGGYDPRVEENMMTLVILIDRAKSASLSYNIISRPSSRTPIPPFNMTIEDPDILFLLNFTTARRAALLTASSTLALLYTPRTNTLGSCLSKPCPLGSLYWRATVAGPRRASSTIHRRRGLGGCAHQKHRAGPTFLTRLRGLRPPRGLLWRIVREHEHASILGWRLWRSSWRGRSWRLQRWDRCPLRLYFGLDRSLQSLCSLTTATIYVS